MYDYSIEQIAGLYYQKDMSQQEIAKYLNISKMNVSRLLQKAKDSQIVQTRVNLPFRMNTELQNIIIKKYNIEDAIVASKDEGIKPDELRSFLGSITAFHIVKSVPVNTIFGMGVGETVGKVAEHISKITTENVKVVQLMGGLTAVSSGNPFSIIQETCRNLSAEGAYISSFAIVEDKEMHNKIFKNDIKRNGVYSLWEQCREAFFGIGSIKTGTFFSEELQKIKKQDTIGDILGHCFGEDGNFIDSTIEDKLISIPINLLNKIPKRTAVAGGIDKAPAIISALQTGIITHLIIDEETAEIVAAE